MEKQIDTAQVIDLYTYHVGFMLFLLERYGVDLVGSDLLEISHLKAQIYLFRGLRERVDSYAKEEKA